MISYRRRAVVQTSQDVVKGVETRFVLLLHKTANFCAVFLAEDSVIDVNAPDPDLEGVLNLVMKLMAILVPDIIGSK